MNERKLLAVALVLNAVTLAAMWTTHAPGPATAQAQIPDSGAQRAAIVDELRRLNTSTEKLVQLLEGGDVQVKVVLPDEVNAAR